MKKLLLFLSFLTFLYSAGFADKSTTFFKMGNSEYEKGNFTKALEYYHEGNLNVSNWKLYYNMGNCYFKSKNFLKAKIYYLKALRLKPFDKSIRKNLNISNLKLGLNRKSGDDSFIEKILLKTNSLLPLNMISFFLLISVFIFNFFLIKILLSGRRRFFIYAIFFSMVAMIFLGGYQSYRIGRSNIHDIGVVKSDKSELLSGPGEGNTTLYNVIKGIQLKIIEKSGEWVYVSGSDTIAGWIKRTDIEII